MGIDPARVCMFVPPDLKKFKLDLFERIAGKIEKAGGRVIRHDWRKLLDLPHDVIPIIGGLPELRPHLNGWMQSKRPFIYWDRGYARRVFATWLPRGQDGGYYRWHLNSFQMQQTRDVPADRWESLGTPLKPWQHHPNGHIVVAMPTPTYGRFHEIPNWTEKTIRALAFVTDRQIVVRDKETKRPLQHDITGALCLVAHGSVAAVESVICGCPVVVHASSAAALVGVRDHNTRQNVGLDNLGTFREAAVADLARVNKPVYPDREAWAHSLAYSNFCESELVDGTLWRLLT